MEIREVGIKQILNPTSIGLGDYVINPYKGCEYSCLYCYVRFNKVTKRENREWGTYIDARINIPLILERELLIKKPARVLLGSTTDCFQPIELKYKLTKKIIETLNRYKVRYSILTRSPNAAQYTAELSAGYLENIYFTVNSYPEELKKLLEPRSPAFAARISAIKELQKQNIPVIPYISPVLPFITDIEKIITKLPEFSNIGIEGLNFNLGNIEKIAELIAGIYPEYHDKYKKMMNDTGYYNDTWEKIKYNIEKLEKQYNKKFDIYIHGLKAYFNNKYN